MITCRLCGSIDIAHYAEWLEGEIPIGIEGFIGCNTCHYWERVLTIAPASSIHDRTKWVVLEAGNHTFSSREEREASIIYRNPTHYPRFDFSKGLKP